jgi:hypothetical protein
MATSRMAANLYDALRGSHEVQRHLLRRLVRSKPGTRERLDLFTRTRIELAAHEAAEERFLYVPMLLDDGGLVVARHALHDHHQADELVEEVQGLDPRGDAWLECCKRLSHCVHHHLREEEKKFFQVSGRVLSEAQKGRSTRGYLRDYERMLRKLAAGG